MLTLGFSAVLLGLLLVESQVATWNSCTQQAEDSLREVMDNLGKNEITLQDVGVCKNFTVFLKNLEAHPDCKVKNCDGNVSNCKDQKLKLRVKNFVSKCDIENAGAVLKGIDPKVPTIEAKEGGVTMDGDASEFVVTVTYRVTCSNGKGMATVTKSEIDSKPGTLSLSCSEGSEKLISTCNMFKDTATRDKVGQLSKPTIESKIPDMLKSITDYVANTNCQ